MQKWILSNFTTDIINGIYVLNNSGESVTDGDLLEKYPFKMVSIILHFNAWDEIWYRWMKNSLTL